MRDPGYQLRQFDQMLRANGLATRLVVVDDGMPDNSIRDDLVQNLRRRDDYGVVNYRREAVGQHGGGHISPLAAYDVVTDSFLVLDVNPTAAGWVWMPAHTLIKGMRTFDTVENAATCWCRRNAESLEPKRIASPPDLPGVKRLGMLMANRTNRVADGYRLRIADECVA